MTRGAEIVTRNVYRINCQADGCRSHQLVQASMLIGALSEVQRLKWSTGGKKNLCPKHADQREAPRPGRRTAAAAAAASKK